MQQTEARACNTGGALPNPQHGLCPVYQIGLPTARPLLQSNSSNPAGVYTHRAQSTQPPLRNDPSRITNRSWQESKWRAGHCTAPRG